MVISANGFMILLKRLRYADDRVSWSGSFNPSLCNDEFIDVEIVVVFGVSDSGPKAFLHVCCDTLAGESEVRKGLVTLLPRTV